MLPKRPNGGSGYAGAAKAPEHDVEMETEVAVTAGELSLHPDAFDGVEQCFAIQAGRELRVSGGADKISDQETSELSANIATKIQNEMTYPGQVKITVIREVRSVNYAK